MWVEETKTGVRIPDAPPLDLAQTLDCGQCFRFEPDGTAATAGLRDGRCRDPQGGGGLAHRRDGGEAGHRGVV